MFTKIRNSRNFIRFVIKPILFIWLFAAGLDLMIGIYLEDLGPDPHERLLHTTGLWALNALILTLAITPLTKWLKWPLLSLVRRMVGLFAFFYASAHLWIFIQFILEFDWFSILKEIVKRPYITIGIIAWLMLIPLAVTSTNAMMRRLGRKWKTLHKSVYLISILAVWHFTWQVKLDLIEPIVYIILLIILLGWRDINQRNKKKKN